MKKIILFISIFFLITLNNSISAPIKLFTLDLTMDVKTVHDLLINANYECTDNMSDMSYIYCSKPAPDQGTGALKTISFSKKVISFSCEVYGGCNYSATEIANHYSKELNLNITNLSSYGITQDPAYCGEGPDGDQMCVVFSLNNNLGPSLKILKHKFGRSGLSSTFN